MHFRARQFVDDRCFGRSMGESVGELAPQHAPF